MAHVPIVLSQPRKLFKLKSAILKMFNKKKCKNCGEKVSQDYNFCPYCRTLLKDNAGNEGWGLLGRNDNIGDIKFPLGFNHLVNSLIKSMNSQFKEVESPANYTKKQTQKSGMKKGGISISITTSRNKPPEIKVTSFGSIPEFTPKQKKAEPKRSVLMPLPLIDSKKFSGMPKKEPETNIRRLSNKVVYEINTPGVKSMEDVSIIQLENSIEIKAFAKDKIFHKIIPINLPITNYGLSDGKLVLELDTR